MFDSGGSSGQLRDELGVLPPGDILKCALALSRNSREARRVLLARLPMLENTRAGRPHRRQFAAVDDAAVQRRLPRCRGRPERAAGLPGPRVAGHGRTGVGLRRVRRRLGNPRRSGGGRGADLRPPGPAHLARAGGVDSPGGHRRHQQARRRRHRARQLLHEPDADLPGPRRGGGAGRHARADHLHREPADGRSRHGRLHGGRGRRPHRGGDAPARGRRHHQHGVAGRRRARAVRAGAQAAASGRATCPPTARWSAASSGPGRSPATIVCGSPTRSGAFSRGAAASATDT